MPYGENKTQWAKIGTVKLISFIGKDIVGFAAGCHIGFINTVNQEEHLFEVTSHSNNGDGVKCFKGHHISNVFAYTERSSYAAGYVVHYPSFERLACFKDNQLHGHLQLTFSESSLIITLGDLPSFQINVWNWRNGERIGQRNSDIKHREQILKCSTQKPNNLAQLAVNTTELRIWDIFVCCKHTVVSEHVVKFNHLNPAPFVDILYTPDHILLVLDKNGCVFTTNAEFYLEKLIDFSTTEMLVRPSMAWHNGGFSVHGPNKEIRHYKKNTEIWNISPYLLFEKIFSNNSDRLAALTAAQAIVLLDNKNYNFTYLRRYEGRLGRAVFIYPTGDYVVIISNRKYLICCEMETGKKVSVWKSSGKVTMMKSNPVFPYVALSYEFGRLDLISAYNPEKLKLMTTFNLTKSKITHIYFSVSGKVFATGNLDEGEFFIIEGIPGRQMNVIATIAPRFQIADWMLVCSQDCYRLFIIPVTHSKMLAGNKIVRYCVLSSGCISMKEYFFDNSSIYIRRIISSKKLNRDRVFYVVLQDSLYLWKVETKRGDSGIKVINTIVTGHQFRKYNMIITKNHVISSGYEGLTFINNLESHKHIAMCMPHHRTLMGVEKSYIDPKEKYILTIGRDNVVCCINIVNHVIDLKKKQELEDLHNSPGFEAMFTRPTIGFMPEDEFKDMTWLEVEQYKKLKAEELASETERNAILEEFSHIKSKMAELITKNMQGPENEKLEPLEFNLDFQSYKNKREKNNADCKYIKTYLKQLIIKQDEVFNLLKQRFWDVMDLKSTHCNAIFSEAVISNFAMLPQSADRQDLIELLIENTMVERKVNKGLSFHPWLHFTEESMERLVRTKPEIVEENTALENLLETDQHDISLDTTIALSGSMAILFIALSQGHYEQREITTFYQCHREHIVTMSETLKLKEMFNKEFYALKEFKEREMQTIQERHARQRHIISETNYFSTDQIYLPIVDPLWGMNETPENIIQVSDSELTVTPYISPSEQAILDAEAAEAERIRLLLLADDFRERALIAMMNGVLEVRWEDELRKEVPIPKCMIDKQPEQFNEEDLRHVRDYEEKCAFLNSERERYKHILDKEFTKIGGSLKESVRRFNVKLSEVFSLRLNIISSLEQEQLKLNRFKLKTSKRKELFTKENEIIKDLSENEEVMNVIQKTITFLQNTLADYKTRTDSVLLKEKILDKNFKRDIQNFSSVVQELCTKLYKKRPKLTLKNITSVSVLYELCKSLLTGERSVLLTPDALEYLKALDNFDLPVGLPPNIDEVTYNVVVKHRRLKIESEIRLKAIQAEIQGGEATIQTFSKRLAIKKERHMICTNALAELRVNRIGEFYNNNIQLVTRKGLVELDLSGDLKDFDDVILIPKEEIEQVNKAIINAGQKKLKTMLQNMAFRRKIMTAEWKHLRKRMVLNDLKEEHADLIEVNLSKEIQNYLKKKKLGVTSEQESSFENEIEIIALSFTNKFKSLKTTLAKHKKELNEITAKNHELNMAINDANVEVCTYMVDIDNELEDNERDMLQRRMESIAKRRNMVQTIQEKHNEILVLQTELELLRLKTYPTFKYKIIE